MVERRTPIPIEEAIERVMKYPLGGGVEAVSIEESDGRVLAKPLLATHPVPPFRKSPYDGFAFRAEDTKGALENHPVTFRIVEHVPAGHVSTYELGRGEAVRIMTGAKIPDEATCVAMFEVCQEYVQDEEEYVSIKREMKAGQNVMEAGSETEDGQVLVGAGKVINPGVKALLATFGYSVVHVYKKPRIGVFATGTELIDVDAPLVDGKIRNSNASMVVSQIKRAGGVPIYFGSLRDELHQSYESMKVALEEVDVLITTGGVSVGDFDLLPAIYEKLGAKVLFNKVAMRPGSVTTVASVDGKLLFGLSGNPSACYAGFELFVRPIIRGGLGTSAIHPPKTLATLKGDFGKANPFTRFVRGKLVLQEGRVFAQPVGIDKSGVVTSLAETTILIKLHGGTRGHQEGDVVDVLLLETDEGDPHTWTAH
ncbi:molybdopterin molybdenumtransferase [Pontibacillus halophilus JSM 076056 = DSM 19796]|uniref:Molybdopterin molybdenumtransferase n=1 Tax=Pontibacillus halophilus JSM 076056 = DSM 19796 TaxID=1385510 RepID=A0A0A5GK61_9BACI|nr:gephyrin-like molybdotransferase Glp [Pontibacillus halophilus]KGX91608.1 molybdopterin molybdenumtransferase [Pontibacillus halophilus JSM 076056 = DSM 19796]